MFVLMRFNCILLNQELAVLYVFSDFTNYHNKSFQIPDINTDLAVKEQQCQQAAFDQEQTQ